MIAHGFKQVELNALRPVNFGLILKHDSALFTHRPHVPYKIQQIISQNMSKPKNHRIQQLVPKKKKQKELTSRV
jgi:hypothetical protein